MKKMLIVATAGVMALVMSSCFTMQGFSVLATSIQPGDKTKAQFVLRPASTTPDKEKAFVIVGVPNGGALRVGKAIWGTNGKFGGPYAMSYQSNLASLVASDGACSSNGLNFASVTNTTWKGFLTPNKVGDRGKVNTKVIVQAILKATAGAGTDTNYSILGVSGYYTDDGDGNVDADDLFWCTGIASVGLYVRP